MPTQPLSPDSSKYRFIEFIGGRILQSDELKRLQSLETDQPANGTYDLGALYQEGSTLNVGVSISNGTVTLSPIDNTQPMLVRVNNRFEAFSPTSYNFTTGANGSTVKLYVNWVLWRVTSDGENGTITDPTLIDAQTTEQIAEMGQLQITIGADDSGSVNTQTMFGRNTVPVPMFTFTWVGTTLTLTGTVTAKTSAFASPTRAGLVETTTSSATVASTDDARLSDARRPIAGSVNSASVQAPTTTGTTSSITYTDQNGSTQTATFNAVQTTGTSGGINSRLSFYDAWSSTVHDAISLCWSKITAIYGVLASYGSRITSLENKPPQDLSFHVGHKLGEANSHPPVVDMSDTANTYHGFEVWGTSGDSGSTTAAFSMLGPDGSLRGLIDHSGNYQYTNPSFSGNLVDAADGFDFRNYYTFAAQALNFMRGGGNFPLLGDVTGRPAANRVGAIQGRPVWDTGTPVIGDVLMWNGSAFQTLPARALLDSVNVYPLSHGSFKWFIFRVGQCRFAYGSGPMMHDDNVPFPVAGWQGNSWANFNGNSVQSASMQVILPNGTTASNGVTLHYDGVQATIGYRADGQPYAQLNPWLGSSAPGGNNIDASVLVTMRQSFWISMTIFAWYADLSIY